MISLQAEKNTAYCFQGAFSAPAVRKCICLIKDKTTTCSNSLEGKLIGNMRWSCKTSYCPYAPATLLLKCLTFIYY